MNLSRSVLLASVLATIVGCGGGSSSPDSENTTTTPTPTPTPEPKPEYSFSLSGADVMDENTTLQIAIDELNAEAASYQISSNHDAVTGSPTDSTILLTASDVNRDYDVTITVKGIDGDTEVVQTFEVHISNTSANALVNKIDNLVAAQDTMTAMSEERAVFSLYTNLAKLSGSYEQNDVAEANAAFNATVATATTEIESSTSSLQQKLSAYKAMAITDVDLEAALTTALAAIDAQGNLVIADLNTIIAEAGVGSSIAGSGYVYDILTGNFSQFVGNTNVGAFEDGVWMYNDTYAYMNNIMPTSLSGQVCEL